MSLLYNSSANKLNKVLIGFYQRFVPWNLLWHRVDGSSIFSPSKLIGVQAPLRIYKLCLQSWLQAFWRMPALPLIHNRLKIAVGLHFSETVLCIVLASWWWCSVCPEMVSKFKKLAAFSRWLTKGDTRYMPSLPLTNLPSLMRTKINDGFCLPSRKDSCILQFL